jgi:acetylglutamate/LysW-gamma-L-alpha-aminoadipate kinase
MPNPDLDPTPGFPGLVPRQGGAGRQPPYREAGGITVIKCGGGEGIDPDRVCAGIAALRGSGERVVLVHGGAADIALLADRLGVPSRTLRAPSGVTSRHTDPAMLDVVQLALAGRVKPRLLAALFRAGVPAVGLTGLDGNLLRATRKTARRAVTRDGRVQLVRDDHSGRITSVDPTVPQLLLSAGLTPVLSPPAADPTGAPLNVDADRAAAALAAALGAHRLILLTAAPGLLADPADPASLLPHHALPPSGPPGGPAGSGGMFRKLVAAREALLGGVPEVRIADGRTAAPVTTALYGAGTRLTLAASTVESRVPTGGPA